MTVAFDTLQFVQRLEREGVGHEQAVAHAQLARDMIVANMASKENLAELKKEIDGSLRELELRMTVRLGAIVAAGVAATAALQKLL